MAMHTPELVLQVLAVLDLLGVFVNALIGGVAARAANFDILGFALIAMVSGLGGGLLRDTLLQAGTPAALTHPEYVLTALVGAVVAFLVPIRGRAWTVPLAVVDALALGCWAITGASKTLGVGLGVIPALLLGMTTAVGGGAIRDVLMQRTPAIFGGNTLYATPALVASGVLVGFWKLGEPVLGSLVGTFVGAALCLLARQLGWGLPPSDSFQVPRLGLPRPRLPRRHHLRRARVVLTKVTRPGRDVWG